MSSLYLHKAVKELNGFSLYYSNELAFIVLKRGENRMNKQFVDTFQTLLDDVEKNEACKGLVTTSSGKFYCNGLDLEWMATLSQYDLNGFRSSLISLFKRILVFPLPTLAALNGHAYAGGAVLALAHDLRTFCLDKGWLCFNEVFINKRFPPFYLSFFRIKLGTGKQVSDALVLGRRYTAQEAFNSGLVHAIPSETLLLDESIRVLKVYSGKGGFPRQSLANMKEDVYKEVIEAYDSDIQKFQELKSKL